MCSVTGPPQAAVPMQANAGIPASVKHHTPCTRLAPLMMPAESHAFGCEFDPWTTSQARLGWQDAWNHHNPQHVTGTCVWLAESDESMQHHSVGNATMLCWYQLMRGPGQKPITHMSMAGFECSHRRKDPHHSTTAFAASCCSGASSLHAQPRCMQCLK